MNLTKVTLFILAFILLLFLLFSEKQVRKIVQSYVNYYNRQRPHQGINRIPDAEIQESSDDIKKMKILSGLHHHYYRSSASIVICWRALLEEKILFVQLFLENCSFSFIYRRAVYLSCNIGGLMIQPKSVSQLDPNRFARNSWPPCDIICEVRHSFP